MINALPGGGSRTIALSKRANIFYLDRVRVQVRHERVVYQEAHDDRIYDYNIPDCNTCLLLLGKGSSITDAAIRCLAKSGVVVGFAGTGGAPLHALVDCVFMNPADEYRPTEYCQAWVTRWMSPGWKLEAARYLQWTRLKTTRQGWQRCPWLVDEKVGFPDEAAAQFEAAIEAADSETSLLLAEAAWTRMAYRTLAMAFKVKDFSRKSGEALDACNSFLDHGNYLMYGLGAVALHALGIPAAFPLLHGKTRRGALVFDVADLYKDGYVLPLAFSFSGANGEKGKPKFRDALIRSAQKWTVLDGMIETIKEISGMDIIDFQGKIRMTEK